MATTDADQVWEQVVAAYVDGWEGRLDRALLEPLRTHDGLAEALRAYLENHGQWEGTAAALGVHRHTARARVARAEDLLGVDLRSARVRAELLLALLLGDE